MIELRDYQRVLVDGARANLRAGVRRQLLVGPTGCGKTVVAAFIHGGAAQRGLTTWFCVHRREIIDQTADTFANVGIDFGLVVAGEPMRPDARVQLCSVQTLANRMDQLPKPRGIVWDECHHIVSATHAGIADANPDAWQIGVTATPLRLDGKGLRPFFDRIVVGPTTGELIRRGFLAPYRYFAPGQPDLVGVRASHGDFNRGDLEKLMDEPKLIGEAVATYRDLADGKRAIIFETSVATSQSVTAAFTAAGIPALHVDGAMDKRDRKAAFAAFREGRIRVLSNVELAGEGVDIPAIEAVILRRPTQSLSLYLQQVGRGLRLFEGKSEAIIIDHAGNAFRHGLPDDPREWTLDGKEKRAGPKVGSDAVPIHQCPTCYRITGSIVRTCPGCGYEFTIEARSVAWAEGQLFELNRLGVAEREAEHKRTRDREKAEERGASLGELMELARARNAVTPGRYKDARKWALMKLQLREQWKSGGRKRFGAR
ncbi:MAG TPA: DEAD/DEAH box helicase [Sphingomonas sp.]